MKKTVCIMLCLLLSLAVVPVGIADDYCETETVIGDPIYLDVEFLENGGSYEHGMGTRSAVYLDTEHCKVVKEVYDHVVDDHSEAPSENTKTRSVTHDYYNSDGAYLATVTVKVTGDYSRADNYAAITSVTAKLKGANASFSYSTVISGDMGYVTLNYNGLPLQTYTYKISANGAVTEL